MKLILLTILLFFSLITFGQESKGEEIIYGHKDGLALSMIMLKPTSNENGTALIYIISGGWRSGYEDALYYEKTMDLYLNNGFTLFLVMHGSQPRYNLMDALSDIKKSVRFIRLNASTLKINPDKIGIIGESSGGHLALMVATTGNDTDMNTSDPIDQVSDRVQAVAVFFPATDFVNFGEKDFAPIRSEALLKDLGLIAAFDFKKWNRQKQEYTFPTAEEQLKLSREFSPLYWVSSDDAPALLIHGDLDDVVPLQQSEVMIEAYQKNNVPNKLVVKKGANHGWEDFESDQIEFIKWFDQYLK
jgi:acetyl esterase/lipase